MRTRLTVLGLVLLVAGCGGGGGSKTTAPSPPPPPPPPPPATTSPATVSAGPIRVTLFAPGHSVKVNATWRYHVRLTNRRGRLLPGKITIQIVDPLGTAHPVQYDDTKQNITNRPFDGVFRDYVQFPPASRGFTLRFRAIVKAAGSRATITYRVTVR